MLTITIAKTTIAYEDALETEEYYNGASRRTLTLTCAPDAIGLDALNALLTEENLAAVTMTNDEQQITNRYEGYVLKLFCGIQNTQTAPETPETPATYADRLVFKLGRRTYLEQALHDLGL